jgi:hypothetical protein
VMGEGGRLLDWESTVGVFTTIKKPKHTTPSALKGLSGGGGGGGGGGGDSSAGGTVHDVGVRGFLPRVNKTAIVSRFNPTLRPASRYMHMASIAKVGDRYLRLALSLFRPPPHPVPSTTRSAECAQSVASSSSCLCNVRHLAAVVRALLLCGRWRSRMSGSKATARNLCASVDLVFACGRLVSTSLVVRSSLRPHSPPASFSSLR